MKRGKSAGLTCAGVVLAALALSVGRGADARPADPSGEPSRTARQARPDAGVLFRNVLNPFDYFSNSWSVVGLKDYPDGTRISPNGELLLGNEAVCELLAGEGLRPLDNSVRMSLVKGYLPIIHYDFLVNDSVEYIIEVFACPMPAMGRAGYDFGNEPNYLNLLRVTMRNGTAAPCTGVFGLGWKAPAPLAARTISAKNDWSLTAGNALLATVSTHPGVQCGTGGSRFVCRAEIRPGKSETVDFCLPFLALDKVPDKSAAELAGLDFEEWKARTAEFWDDLLGRGAKLYVPEEKALYSYLASLVYQFIGRDKGELHAGEGFYDEIYLRDGAYQAVSLAQAGFLDAARQSLDFFPRFQRESGQFVSQPGQLDANGYAVWAMTEYGHLSGDNIWVWKNYPAVQKAVAFARKARSSEKDSNSPFFGILPKAPADGENLWAGNNHIVGYDWWNLRAVESAAESARLLAKVDDMKAYKAEFESYRTDILRALDRTGLPYIPPSYEKEGTHWGNLEAIFPTPLIDPWDRRMTATLDYVRQEFGRGEGARPGFIEGVMQWTPKTNAIHPYMSLFVTNSHIVRGEQEKAVDGFYSFLLHSTSTQGFPEGVYYLKREAWGNTVPHLWAAALYVSTLRNMLIREENQDLHLFSAVPAAWLDPGKVIVFENVPTRFGKMSLSAQAQKDQVIVRFTRPDRIDPERLLIHLPPDLEITEVGRCGKIIKTSQMREVLIPGWNLREGNVVTICIRRRPGVPHPDFAAKLGQFLAGTR